MIDIRETTLEAILFARDRRVEKQKEIVSHFSTALISFMVNMPGANKSTPLSTKIFDEGLSSITKALSDNGFSPIYKDINYYDTGAEALISVDCDSFVLKRILLNVEESHPLGRLFDFDVIGSDGKSISREMLGLPKRKCLLCNDEAYSCGRSRRHSVEDLVVKIREMVESFLIQ